jgi:(E)-4-hydroxy-3-methylbut-2-enyl-diphosphate synthase
MAYQMMAQECDYPFHLGITEAGYGEDGMIKSSVGLGAILLNGMGDTIRVSLTEDSIKEVETGYNILKSVGVRQRGPEFISCPSCGRVEIDLHGVAGAVKERLKDLDVPMSIAVMGCAVNGPGESREADLGFSGGKGQGALFRKGKLIRTIKEEDSVEAIVEEALRIAEEMRREQQ